jgi:hypothetical protein
MKKILVKNKIIIPGKEPVLNELGEVIEMGTQNRYEAGEQVDESGILASQEEVDFFISQRPQFICEVVDVTEEVSAIKAKEAKKKAAKEALKSLSVDTVDFDAPSTIAGLKVQLKALKVIVKALIEASE